MSNKKENLEINLANLETKIKKLQLQKELYLISLQAIEKKENLVSIEEKES